MSRAAAELAAAFFAALESRDRGRLAALLDPAVEVRTGRSVHAGVDRVLIWAGKEFDHLRRRFRIDSYRSNGDSLLAIGVVQYVWKDGSGIADCNPIAIGVEVRAGGIARVELHDDVAAALVAFDR